MTLDEVLKVVAALNRREVAYAVFGGIAVNLHGHARATEDLDLFVDPDRDNLVSLKAALREVYDDPDIDQIDVDELAGEYPAVRYVPPQGDSFLDILTRLGTAFRFEDLDVVTKDVRGIPVRVVSLETLIRMKSDTVRLKDKADAEALRVLFGLGESR